MRVVEPPLSRISEEIECGGSVFEEGMEVEIYLKDLIKKSLALNLGAFASISLPKK